jgi:pimeloyl-ACP methyl ester carboxylesterase
MLDARRRALEDEYDIVAYDARFHGKSDAVDNPPEGAGADLISVVEQLGLERPAIMGHSMGAGAVPGSGGTADLFRCAVLKDPGFACRRPRAPGRAAARPACPRLHDNVCEEVEAAGRTQPHARRRMGALGASKQFRRPPSAASSLGPPGAWRTYCRPSAYQRC